MCQWLMSVLQLLLGEVHAVCGTSQTKSFVDFWDGDGQSFHVSTISGQANAAHKDFENH